MHLTNMTTGAVLATNLRRAASYWARFRGLMLRRRLGAGEGLAIEPCSSIHMMFMLFSIDAVFYDRELVVTRVSRKVRPWIGFAASRGAAGVCELPAGCAAGTERGHQLALDERP